MLIDLHCHTTRSQDSRLSPREAVKIARKIGLDAICFTEHDFLWDASEIRELARETGFSIFAGVEVSTEIGHVLAYGLPDFELTLRTFSKLVATASECGASLVLAHPYRRHYRFDLPSVISETDVVSALRRRGLSEVAGIEAGNGGTRPIENALAWRVAERLGLPTTAGSDAHAPERMGLWATQVDGSPRNISALSGAISGGRVRSLAGNEILNGRPKGQQKP